MERIADMACKTFSETSLRESFIHILEIVTSLFLFVLIASLLGVIIGYILAINFLPISFFGLIISTIILTSLKKSTH